MAERTTHQDKRRLYISRAKQLNRAFIFVAFLFYVVSLLTYKFFSMPVSPKLAIYVYAINIVLGLIAYSSAFLIRRYMFPVDSSKDKYWSYTATRRYFWSYVLLSLPFFISFLFYIFAGHLYSLTLGFLITLAGLLIFKPREMDVT